MKKYAFLTLLLGLSLGLFSDELSIARQYVDNNRLLGDYNFLDLNLDRNKTKTFLFYIPNNNRQLNTNNSVLSITDAVIIKSNNEKIIQYLIINKNGLVKANDSIIFYDFSETGYSHIKFNGWLLELNRKSSHFNNAHCIGLQLANNEIQIPADPPLPVIIWDYELNYPIKYHYTMHPLPSPAWLIEYEWREDIKISIARTGLRDNDILKYIDGLSAYDKRIIVNAMFALHGYEFKTTEWINYFSKLLWYKPDNEVINSAEILDKYQKKLFEYLTN
ncbi:MAG: YARHG domain-containing protein [Treponema sp.]|nr:YARHG domain-containing protein [Treponema sp.]